VQCSQTIMRSAEDKASLAREVLALIAPEVLKDKLAAGSPAQRLDPQP